MKAAPSENQLRSHINSTLEKYGASSLLGFYSPVGYSGRTELTVGSQTYRIETVESCLHFHQLAALAEAGQAHYVALCPDRDWLTQDLKDRLPGRQLQELDPWESLRQAFGAEQIESRLKSDKRLAIWLQDIQNPNFPKVPGGHLTFDFAVEVLLYSRLQLTRDCADPVSCLLALRHLGDQQPVGIEDDLLEFVIKWFLSKGPAQTEFLVRLYVQHGARQALAFALVVECIYAQPQLPESLLAQGRLERFLDGRPLPVAVGRSLAKNVQEFVRWAESTDWLGGSQTLALQRLKEINAHHLASNSLVLEAGWDRLVLEATDGAGKFSQLSQHFLFAERQDDVEQLRMVYRIQAFLASPPCLEDQTSLASLLRLYLDNICWLDKARNWLSYPHSILGEVFQNSRLAVQPWRDQFNQVFAQALAQANGQPAQGYLPIEDFVERILRPLLDSQRKLLMIVLDGCSQATLLDLIDSFDGLNWSHYRPELADHQRLLSALPSVTQVARTSLFSGTLCQGQADSERRNFQLRFPKAKIHHKAEMKAALLEARSEEHQLVAVVVNTIDDTLAKDDQLDLRWTSTLIAPLEPLLDAARMSNRLVLLVSDHGHLLDWGTRELPAKDGGNRWQPTASSKSVAGALSLEGGRLLLAPQAQLLYDENLRFGPKKRGYHGGISPQEMCCALALLAPSASHIPKWSEEARKPPEWWQLGRGQRAKIQIPDNQGLFDQVLSERLMSHSLFAGRLGCPAYLAGVIDELHQSDYSREELRQRLALSRTQFNQLLPQWSRWLNINGLMLLRSDTNSIWLDAPSVEKVLRSEP